MTVSPSVQLITEATVAQYIHEISARHQPRHQARRLDPRVWHGGSPRVDEVAAIRRARERLTPERAAA